jgi:hypothetical protein
MAKKTTKRSRKLRRISYQDFRNAVTADACCAGDGSDSTTTLATLIVRDLTGAKPAEMLEQVLSQGEGTPVHGVWHHGSLSGDCETAVSALWGTDGSLDTTGQKRRTRPRCEPATLRQAWHGLPAGARQRGARRDRPPHSGGSRRR